MYAVSLDVHILAISLAFLGWPHEWVDEIRGSVESLSLIFRDFHVASAL